MAFDAPNSQLENLASYINWKCELIIKCIRICNSSDPRIDSWEINVVVDVVVVVVVVVIPDDD